MVSDSGAVTGKNRQRDQELLEHAHQAKAPEPRAGPQTHRPLNAVSPSPPPPSLFSAAAAQKHESPIVPDVIVAAAVPKAEAAYSTDDGHSSGGEAPTQHYDLDLNLDLSISLPSYNYSPRRSPQLETVSNNSTCTGEGTASAAYAQSVCLCYHLGFQSGDACTCQAIPNPHIFRYIRPLEDAQ
uniref:Uncharacterized protein n=1 Tax=Ananas comosus var. bracteatus TaxID=296719 RepID=A0A6V7QGJ2_ANACO|nr:unnamed protein product [Ananas comosus var. bracteatus]